MTAEHVREQANKARRHEPGHAGADAKAKHTNGAVPPSLPEQKRPRVLDAGAFLGEFKPIESIIDGLPIPRSGIVSVTGPTGSGKTTLCCAIQLAITFASKFAGRDATGGSVLVLAGENPDDYAMHLMATVQQAGLPSGDLCEPGCPQLFVVPGVFDVLQEIDWLHERVEKLRVELTAVFVDTSAAYYVGEDENDNVSMRRHASVLRELCTLPGRPTVFVLCHPTKNAGKDNLMPRGGGAFLAEVDGNLTVWKDDAGIVTLHHAGKIRGPGFEPIRFELVSVQLDGRVDCRGRPIYSVAVKHLPDERAELLEARAMDDGNRILVAMQKKPGGSVADLGMAAGMTTGAGQPQKSRVHRLLETLKKQGLATTNRLGTWRLTAKGRKEADELP